MLNNSVAELRIINYYLCGEIAGGTSAGMLMYVIMLGKLVVCQNTYNFIWFLIYGGRVY